MKKIISFVLCLCMIGLASFVMWADFALPGRFARLDLTEENSYTISDGTRSFLKGLERDVTIWVLNSDKNDRRMEMFLDRLTDYSSRLQIEYVNTAENTAFAEHYGLAGLENITPYSLIIESDARYQYVDYLSLFSFSNETLGVEDMTVSEYQYYLQLF